MKVEGIIIQKTPYKERDLICNILLRSGKTISVYFYGGRGGGKQSKGSIVELGHMLALELNLRKKSNDSQLYTVKEYKLLWSGQFIRDHFEAFYLYSFYIEFLGKIAVEDDLDGFEDDHHHGLFNVLSNGLFYLDESIRKKNFILQNHLFIFLARLSVQLGITVDVELCMYCFESLDNKLCLFGPGSGGFACMECSSKRDEFLSENKLLLEEYQSSTNLKKILGICYRLPYKDYEKMPEVAQGLTISQFQYINLQFGFTKEQFKSWNLISAF